MNWPRSVATLLWSRKNHWVATRLPTRMSRTDVRQDRGTHADVHRWPERAQEDETPCLANENERRLSMDVGMARVITVQNPPTWSPPPPGGRKRTHMQQIGPNGPNRTPLEALRKTQPTQSQWQCGMMVVWSSCSKHFLTELSCCTANTGWPWGESNEKSCSAWEQRKTGKKQPHTLEILHLRDVVKDETGVYTESSASSRCTKLSAFPVACPTRSKPC